MAFEDKTPELLHAAMLDSINATIDKREGSVVHDLTYPAAIEISNAYVELDSVLGLGFAETTEGIYLDMRAGEFGVTRKPSLKAQGSVTLTGPIGTLVPAGTRLQTATEIYFVTLADVTLTSGTGTVTAEAEVGGIAGNVAPNTITLLAPGNLYGIVTVTNALAFDGGADTETDDALRTRLQDRVRTPATSGNAAHYKQWALEVAGVGDAKVYPIWNGNGTVKVVIVDTEKTAPAQTVIDAATTYINTNKPIGATVTVIGASELAINVSATLTLATGVVLADVTALFTTALTNYLKSIAFIDNEPIRYTRIANLILDIPGVTDYASLLVNNGTANIQPTTDQIGVVGTVTFS